MLQTSELCGPILEVGHFPMTSEALHLITKCKYTDLVGGSMLDLVLIWWLMMTAHWLTCPVLEACLLVVLLPVSSAVLLLP